MTLPVIQPNEAIKINNIKLYIYGDPSMGKTTLGMTAKNALIIDADKGAYRAGSLRRAPVLPVDVWHQISNLTQEDLEPYDTIVIDTIGRLLDLVKASFSSNRNNTQANGALKLNVYGSVNIAFGEFINKLNTYGKDIVYLAHATEDKNGETEEIIKRPDLGGKNRNEIYRQSDCMAYFTTEQKRNKTERVLRFSRGDNYHSKDCANLHDITVPDLANNPTFLADLIQGVKDHLNTLTPEQKKHIEQEQEWVHWQQQCNEAEFASHFNELTQELSNYSNNPHVRNMWIGLKKCAKNMNLIFDEKNKRWNEDKTA